MKSDLGNVIFDTINSMNEVRAMELGLPKTRGAKQREIERAIVAFCPDFMEASDIMDAIMASLERRYENELQDANECVKWWQEALEKVDRKLNEHQR